MGSLHTETQSLHPILPIQSCKWVRYNFQTHFFLYTLLQINYGWEYQWHIITILFLVFELFFNQKQIIWYNSFTWSSPTMTIPACWFLIQILHIYKKLVFFFFLFQQQCKRLIFLFAAIEFAEKVKSLTLQINQWFNFVSLTRINPSQHLSANSKPCWTSYCED